MIYFVHIFEHVLFLNEVLTFHVLSVISILNLSFFLGRKGANQQHETKCPGDKSHLKKWFKIQNVNFSISRPLFSALQAMVLETTSSSHSFS